LNYTALLGVRKELSDVSCSLTSRSSGRTYSQLALLQRKPFRVSVRSETCYFVRQELEGHEALQAFVLRLVDDAYAGKDSTNSVYDP
jgi:hypothetical protein